MYSDTEIRILHLQPQGEHGRYIFPRRIADDPSAGATQSLSSCQATNRRFSHNYL